MKKVLFISSLVAFFLTGCSFDECSSKKMLLKSVENLAKDIEKNHSDFTKEDWEEKDERFKKLTGECYKNLESEFTEEEKKKYVKNSLKYTFYRVKSEIVVNFDDIDFDDIYKNIDLLADKGEEFSQMLRKLGKDDDVKGAIKNFEKGMKSVEKVFNKYGKDLEKILEGFNDK